LRKAHRVLFPPLSEGLALHQLRIQFNSGPLVHRGIHPRHATRPFVGLTAASAAHLTRSRYRRCGSKPAAARIAMSDLDSSALVLASASHCAAEIRIGLAPTAGPRRTCSRSPLPFPSYRPGSPSRHSGRRQGHCRHHPQAPRNRPRRIARRSELTGINPIELAYLAPLGVELCGDVWRCG
jgi:hypothetical protein